MIKNLLGLDTTCCLIGGQWVAPQSNVYQTLTNPSDGIAMCEIARGGDEDINLAVQSAQSAAQGKWGSATAAERGRVLAKLGHLVLAKTDELAKLEAMDVGKPLKQAYADVIALARYLEFYAGACDKLHGQTIPYLDGYTVYTLREPYGVTGHIIPWNYPMQIIGISFTGSVGVGKLIQKTAADSIVPVTLELGGKSPQVVFEDADLTAALPFLVNAGIQNAGQTCSASSRILVQESRFQEVVDAMAERYASLLAGPAIADLDVGPLVSSRQKDIVDSYIERGKDLEILAQGSIVDDAPQNGAYVAPTLFACDSPDHVLAQEEIFGPVQVVIPFKDEDEAVAIANGTGFGLVASCWTKDGARQMRMAKRLKAGQVFLNNYGAGGGVELPFGGVGLSGHGREKGFEALYGFTVLKTVAALHG